MKLETESFLDLKEDLAAKLEAQTMTRDQAVKALVEVGWTETLAIEFVRNTMDGEGE